MSNALSPIKTFAVKVYKSTLDREGLIVEETLQDELSRNVNVRSASQAVAVVQFAVLSSMSFGEDATDADVAQALELYRFEVSPA